VRTLAWSFAASLIALIACSSKSATSADASVHRDGAACASTPRTGCCFDDGDCTGNTFCVAATCAAQGEGRCEMPAGAGGCWSDLDCTGGSTCRDARVCSCGAQCLLPDAPGTCK
jgi:hypothetical protein